MAIILSIIACSSLPFAVDTAGTATSQVVADIPYCDADSSVLCLISFGNDNKGRMSIDFYKPDHSTKNFYLKVNYDQIENVYDCQAVKGFTKYISCTGEQIPLEEQIDIGVYLSKDDTLIARGIFVISSFAIATPVIVTVTEAEAEPDSTPTATLTPTRLVINTPRPPTITPTPNTLTPEAPIVSITPTTGTPGITFTPSTKTLTSTNTATSTSTPTSTNTVTPTRTSTVP